MYSVIRERNIFLLQVSSINENHGLITSFSLMARLKNINDFV